MREMKAETRVLTIPEPTDRLAVLMHLEQIGRICYKSEDKITEQSCIKFIQTLRNRKHWAMLEHYIFAISVPKDTYEVIIELGKINREPDLIHAMKFINCTFWKDATDESMKYIVSGSATAFNYIMECNYVRLLGGLGMKEVCSFLADYHPELMADPHDAKYDNPDIRFLSRKEVKSLPKDIRVLHDFQSVIFTVDRGVTHELVRHRVSAWAQESTRYCNYSNGKYDNSIAVITPFFFEGCEELDGAFKNIIRKIPFFGHWIFPSKISEWARACKYAEKRYMKLIKLGATSQEARSVLPQSTKADIAMTATLHEFRHFFKMRVPKSAHPQMREVTIPLLKFMKGSYNGGIYDDLFCGSIDDDLHIELTQEGVN